MNPPQVDLRVTSQNATETSFSLAQLCQRDILTLSAEAPVRQAAEMMRTHHVGALALADQNQGQGRSVLPLRHSDRLLKV